MEIRCPRHRRKMGLAGAEQQPSHVAAL